jgi:hypothetical protein
MSERRSLTEGLRATPPVDTSLEKQFVYGEKSAPVPAPVVNRVPLSTRIRADYAAALKRASLERQLQGVEPSTLQDMLEQALEPWLKANGYLS